MRINIVLSCRTKMLDQILDKKNYDARIVPNFEEGNIQNRSKMCILDVLKRNYDVEE